MHKRGGLGADRRRGGRCWRTRSLPLAFVPALAWIGASSARRRRGRRGGRRLPHGVQDDGRLLGAYARTVKHTSRSPACSCSPWTRASTSSCCSRWPSPRPHDPAAAAHAGDRGARRGGGGVRAHAHRRRAAGSSSRRSTRASRCAASSPCATTSSLVGDRRQDVQPRRVRQRLPVPAQLPRATSSSRCGAAAAGDRLRRPVHRAVRRPATPTTACSAPPRGRGQRGPEHDGDAADGDDERLRRRRGASRTRASPSATGSSTRTRAA